MFFVKKYKIVGFVFILSPEGDTTFTCLDTIV